VYRAHILSTYVTHTNHIYKISYGVMGNTVLTRATALWISWAMLLQSKHSRLSMERPFMVQIVCSSWIGHLVADWVTGSMFKTIPGVMREN